MIPVLGQILPLAVGIAISPIPIIAAILMLLSPKARSTSVGFLAGWLAGILATVVVVSLLASVIPQGDPDAQKPVTGVIQLLLGTAALTLTVVQWRKRPRDGAEPTLPKWMSAIETMTAARALTLGLALSALNPKNLLLGLSAGVDIGAGELGFAEQAVVVAVFVIIAAITVAGPVIAYLVAADRMKGPLDALRAWLVRNNSTVMTVLMLVLGTNMIGKGLGNF